MTLEEKAGLCSGLDFWHTKAVERLGVPSIMMCDGPHGLRKQAEGGDHGVNASVPATCFPTGTTIACSWDRKLIEKIGAAIGEECQAEDVSIVLGPSANIKRSPLCGRNFEYLSEDPFLSSEMAASHIMGVQSQGVGTSLKHYAANNQEHRRFLIDAVVDERTLREIYLASFEGAVIKSQPWTVMCAYNKVNGNYCSENKYLLTDILKDEWGHEGFVISDWGAVNERADGLAAGLELEMPSSSGEGDKKIVSAVRNGLLSESVLDEAVERLLKVIFMAVDNKKPNASYDREAHHRLAREAARECMVLLKNEDNILPLKKEGNIAIIGAFAKHPRYQGGGSSHINPSMMDNAFDEIEKAAGQSVKLLYADGYKLDNEGNVFFGSKAFTSNSDEACEELLTKAREAAASSDTAVVFAGLPDSYESEGFDRIHMRIPEGHRRLIEAVAEVQKNVVVILSNGSPIEMPWLDKVKGVLEGYLGGQAFGGAVADLLFGTANPCGKLAETFPKCLNDNPSYLNFPGDEQKVEYREGLFVGYRYYDTKGIEPLFPFGYGLSYTSFEYTGISLDKNDISDTDALNVRVKVKNTGIMAGKEIVQLYVRDIKSSVIRPDKELKGFEKVELDPGEEKEVIFTLGKRAFAYYNTDIKDWYVESGEFEILVGGSSREPALKASVRVKSTFEARKKYTRNSSIGELMADPAGAEIVNQLFRGFGVLSGPEDASGTGPSGAMAHFISGLPLRSLFMMSRGKFTEDDLGKILGKLNRE
jgi:beta-glucosidase